MLVGSTTTCSISAYHHRSTVRWVFFPADEVFHFSIFYIIMWDRRGCDHMVVEFTTIYAISDLRQVGGFLRFPSPIKLKYC